MADQESKGFRVIDKRGISEEKPEDRKEEKPADRKEAGPPPSQPPPPKTAAGPQGPAEPGRPGAETRPPRGESSSIMGPTFLDLVGTLQFGAMANLGMIQTPDGKRTPVNLPAAKDSIDMLGILQEKTKGNLTEEESGVLAEGLYHIRMAYVAAVKAAAGEPGGGKKR